MPMPRFYQPHVQKGLKYFTGQNAKDAFSKPFVIKSTVSDKIKSERSVY